MSTESVHGAFISLLLPLPFPLSKPTKQNISFHLFWKQSKLVRLGPPPYCSLLQMHLYFVAFSLLGLLSLVVLLTILFIKFSDIIFTSIVWLFFFHFCCSFLMHINFFIHLLGPSSAPWIGKVFLLPIPQLNQVVFGDIYIYSYFFILFYFSHFFLSATMFMTCPSSILVHRVCKGF